MDVKGIQGDHWVALAREGWAIKDPEGRALIAGALDSGGSASLAALRKAALDCDLRKAGSPSLPEDVNRAAQGTIQGPVVLQVAAVDDISQPSRASAESGAGAGRMLRFKLTDGSVTATCIEYQPIDGFSPAIAPGTKVQLKEKVQIRSGIVLLDKKSISVLGGRVESLAEAWEVQRKFGGLDRLRPSGPDADEIPPPFKQFQPGHKSKPKPLRPAETPAAAQITPPFPPGLQPRAEEPPPPPGGGRGGRGRGRGARGEAEVQERGCVVQQGGEGGGSGEHRQSARGVRGRGVVGVRSPGRPEAVEPPQREEGQQRREGHSRLQGKLAAGEQQRREELEEKRQRHRQNRARRRGGGDDGYGGGGDDGSMTLEEYEARRKAQQAPRELTQMERDEQLALQLQREMDLEDNGGGAPGPQPPGAASDLLASLFSYDRPHMDDGGRGRRGRGRGGGRGRRGGGSGRL